MILLFISLVMVKKFVSAIISGLDSVLLFVFMDLICLWEYIYF